jgi:hypothetical protein
MDVRPFALPQIGANNTFGADIHTDYEQMDALCKVSRMA